MTAVAGLIAIDGPLPRAPLYTLLSVATPLSEGVLADGSVDPHWLAGATVYGYPPDTPVGDDPCSEGSPAGKTTPGAAPLPDFVGFTAYLGEICTAAGIGDWAEFQRRANVALLARESFAAERQLVAGSFVDNPYLGDTALPNYDTLGTAGPTEALALLEDAIGRTGQAGVIHATPSTVIAWAGASLLDRQGTTLLTWRGTPIAVGDGYIDQTPDGAGALSADQQYAWATGPVVYRRSDQVIALPETLGEALDRDTNEVIYRAERDLFVAWDLQLQTAVNVDRSL